MAPPPVVSAMDQKKKGREDQLEGREGEQEKPRALADGKLALTEKTLVVGCGRITGRR